MKLSLTLTTGISNLSQLYRWKVGSRFHRGGGASINPANRHDVVGYVQISGRDDLEKAVAAAKNALSSWRKRSGPERGEFLHRMANVLERRADQSGDDDPGNGQDASRSQGGDGPGIALLRYYAGEGMRKVGDVIPSTDSGGLMFTTRVPSAWSG